MLLMPTWIAVTILFHNAHASNSFLRMSPFGLVIPDLDGCTRWKKRREVLGGLGGALVGCFLPSPVHADSMALSQNGPLVPGTGLTPRVKSETEGSWSPPLTIQTNLGSSRLFTTTLSPLMPSPFSEQELYYAPFLFGRWNVTATLKRKIYPYGREFVPSNSLLEGSPRNREEKVGSTTCYEVHYFSTLANTFQNQLTVQLGTGVPKSRVIADRAYNAISLSKAYKQFTPVQDVQWDPTKDPTRLSLGFGAAPVAEDMRPLGPRRGEIYLRARQTESMDDNNVFACTEQSRVVTLAQGVTIVSDTESITEFTRIDPNTVQALNRIAVFLTPNPNSREGILWQQVGGRAVAFFDYEIEMKRITEPFVVEDQVIQKACVETPKGFVQCE